MALPGRAIPEVLAAQSCGPPETVQGKRQAARRLFLAFLASFADKIPAHQAPFSLKCKYRAASEHGSRVPRFARPQDDGVHPIRA